jgi:3',5'-cyclic AMP phosphodiesterase CpdA
LLHISDIHFGPPHRDELDEAIRSLLARERFDAVLVSGDITQRATPEQFMQAKAFLNSLSVPHVTVPGNHDVPLWAVHERLTTPFGRYQRYFAAELEPTLRLPHAWIYGMNSAHGLTAKNGKFTDASLERCEAFFAAAPADVLRIVVVHHHLLPAPGPLYDPTAARAREAAYAFSRARVDVVVSGHLHHAFVVHTRAFYPKLQYNTVVAHSGTTMSSRGRGAELAANSLNVIALDGSTISIENRRYVNGDKLFEPAVEYRFPRQLPG